VKFSREAKKLTTLKGFVVPQGYVTGEMTDFDAFEYLSSSGLEEEASQFYFSFKAVPVPSGFVVNSPNNNTYYPGQVIPFTSKDYGNTWDGFQQYVNDNPNMNWSINQFAGDVTPDEEAQLEPFMEDVNLQLQQAFFESGASGMISVLESYEKNINSLFESEKIDELTRDSFLEQINNLQNVLEMVESDSLTEKLLNSGSGLLEISKAKNILETYGVVDSTVSYRMGSKRDSSDIDINISAPGKKRKTEENRDITKLSMGLVLAKGEDGFNKLKTFILDKFLEKGKSTKNFNFNDVFSMLGKNISYKDGLQFIRDIDKIINDSEQSSVEGAVAVAERIFLEKQRQKEKSEESLTVAEKISDASQTMSLLSQQIYESTGSEREKLRELRSQVSMESIKHSFQGGGLFVEAFLEHGFDISFFKENFYFYKINQETNEKTFIDINDVENIDWANFSSNYLMVAKSNSVKSMKSLATTFRRYMLGSVGVKEQLVRRNLSVSGEDSLSELIPGRLKESSSAIFDSVSEKIVGNLPSSEVNEKQLKDIVEKSIKEVLSEENIAVEDYEKISSISDRIVDTIQNSSEFRVGGDSINGHQRLVARQNTELFIQFLASQHLDYDHTITSESVSIMTHFLGEEATSNSLAGVFENEEQKQLYFSIFSGVKNGVIPSLDKIISDGWTLTDVNRALLSGDSSSHEALENLISRKLYLDTHRLSSSKPRGTKVLSNDVNVDISSTEATTFERTQLKQTNMRLLNGGEVITQLASSNYETRVQGLETLKNNIDNETSLPEEQKTVIKDYLDYSFNKAQGTGGTFGFSHEWVAESTLLINQAQTVGINNLRILNPSENEFFDSSNAVSGGFYGFSGFTFTDNSGKEHLIGKPSNDTGGGIDITHFAFDSEKRELEVQGHEVKMERDDVVAPTKNNLDRYINTVIEGLQHYSGGEGNISLRQKGTLTTNLTQTGEVRVDCTKHENAKKIKMSTSGISQDGVLTEC